MKRFIFGSVKSLIFVFSLMMAGFYSGSKYGDEKAIFYLCVAIVCVIAWIEIKSLLIKIIENKKPT